MHVLKRVGMVVGMVLVAAAPSGVSGQEAPEVVVGLGGGGSFYSIVSRTDTGVLLRGSLAYSPTPHLVVEGGARWHDCVDCTRFLIGEAGVQLRRPGERWAPFVGAGVGISSDPDFMGNPLGLHASVGSWVWLSDTWGIQLEARGRQVGRGDHMGEGTVLVSRRFRR
jgi:hypothetical protein